MNQTDRLAMYLVKAVIGAGEDMKRTAGGRTVFPRAHDTIDHVAWQVSKQGLLPEDLDRAEGRDALHAIADVVRMRKRGMTIEGWETPAVFHRLPREWQHVTLHAKRLLDMLTNPKR